MCFFDSPTARCELIHELVLTDETQVECAREHECPPGTVCPLCSYFVEGPASVGSGARSTATRRSPELRS